MCSWPSTRLRRGITACCVGWGYVENFGLPSQLSTSRGAGSDPAPGQPSRSSGSTRIFSKFLFPQNLTIYMKMSKSLFDTSFVRTGRKEHVWQSFILFLPGHEKTQVDPKKSSRPSPDCPWPSQTCPESPQTTPRPTLELVWGWVLLPQDAPELRCATQRHSVLSP